jgi:hypothetical protein
MPYNNYIAATKKVLMQITIILQDKNGVEVKTIVANQEDIAEAHTIVHNGKHYAYKNSTGFAFNNIVFQEVNPPVVIS